MHAYISLFCQFRGTRSNETIVALSIANSRSWFLILFSDERNQNSTVTWLVLGQGQKTYRTSQVLLIVDVEVRNYKECTQLLGCVKETWSQLKEPLRAKAGKFVQNKNKNNIILG